VILFEVNCANSFVPQEKEKLLIICTKKKKKQPNRFRCILAFIKLRKIYIFISNAKCVDQKTLNIHDNLFPIFIHLFQSSLIQLNDKLLKLFEYLFYLLPECLSWRSKLTLYFIVFTHCLFKWICIVCQSSSTTFKLPTKSSSEQLYFSLSLELLEEKKSQFS
jgi:hypothetical protein